MVLVGIIEKHLVFVLTISKKNINIYYSEMTYKVKVSMIGNFAVGKSSILNVLNNKKEYCIQSTLGVDFFYKTFSLTKKSLNYIFGILLVKKDLDLLLGLILEI